MSTLKNISPLGAIELPLIGRTLEPGEEFEVPEEQAKVLLAQVGNYQRADTGDGLDKLKVAELRQYADDHGVDVDEDATKADILAAIRKKG